VTIDAAAFVSASSWSMPSCAALRSAASFFGERAGGAKTTAGYHAGCWRRAA
jgi:hypothetical protein